MVVAVMRSGALVFWLGVLATGLNAAEPQPSTPEVKDKIHAVIRQQMEAFRKDDFAGAYKFAAKGIRDAFPVEAFEKMVRSSYPLIPKSTEEVFGLTLDDGKRAAVTVRVVGKDKQSESYQYLLEHDGETWRIAGVTAVEEKSETI